MPCKTRALSKLGTSLLVLSALNYFVLLIVFYLTTRSVVADPFSPYMKQHDLSFVLLCGLILLMVVDYPKVTYFQRIFVAAFMLGILKLWLPPYNSGGIGDSWYLGGVIFWLCALAFIRHPTASSFLWLGYCGAYLLFDLHHFPCVGQDSMCGDNPIIWYVENCAAGFLLSGCFFKLCAITFSTTAGKFVTTANDPI